MVYGQLMVTLMKSLAKKISGVVDKQILPDIVGFILVLTIVGLLIWDSKGVDTHGLIIGSVEIVLSWKGLIVFFANEEWVRYYQGDIITHLPKTYSGHNPLLVTITNTRPTNIRKPFRLEPFWCSHPEFTNVVTNSWHNRNISEALDIFKENITTWSSSTFGDIFRGKNTFQLG